MNLRTDIYYNPQYSKLYLNEGASLFEFEYNEEDNYLYNLAIKKPIQQVGKKAVSGYFDLETPYGYGGYLTNSGDTSFIQRAFKRYKERCIEEKIIAEFISFHPFNSFPVKHSEQFDFCVKDREVVVVDLSLSDEERWQQYPSKMRTILRKCGRDLEIVTQKGQGEFIDLYHQTMQKNKATDFYYFDEEYFKEIFAFNDIHLMSISYERQLASAGLFMLSPEIAHYHLSANNASLSNRNGNYALLEEAIKLAKSRGCQYLLLGGGRTPDKDDTLFRFKSKFSPLTKDFYLAGNVFEKTVYEEYISLWEEQNPGNQRPYFLKYRL